MPKYKLTPTVLEERHIITKLERDGFSRENIHKQMYNITDGATNQERQKIMQKLYDRSEK